MAKKEKVSTESPTVDNVTVLPVAPAAPAPAAPPAQERLSEADCQALEVAKLKRQLVLKDAEKAIAENNAADLSYRYLILQLYMKYGLTAADALDEQGNVHRGANQQTQG